MNNSTTPPSSKRKFRTRVFAAFGILFSFLVTAFAGVILYLRPEGSLANWTRWNFLGVDKKGWEGIHTLFIILLALFTLLHVAFNWKALWNYAKRRNSKSAGVVAEFAAALLLVAFLLVAALNRWPPFWKIIDFRSAIKAGKYSVKIQPPAANTEEWTLAELAEKVGMSVEDISAKLRAGGLIIDDPGTTLGKLAKKNNMSPETVYRIVSGK